MNFAFSTVACPKWDFETIASRAEEYGYGGVEIRGFLHESVMTASNVFLSDPEKVKTTFDSHNVKICCLASSIAYEQQAGLRGALKRGANERHAGDVRQFVDMAERVGCGIVKIFDTSVLSGQNRVKAGIRFGDWLAPLGDYAAERGVMIVVENALSFRDAKELWFILDRLQHPSLATAWDVFNAALIGETPAVSVPTLNSRIQYAHVKDAKLGPLGATYCKLGEGDVQVKNFLTRLRGIGYGGWITLEWEKAWLPNIADPEDVLPDSILKLKDWTKPQVDKADGKSHAAKGKPAAAAH